MKKEEEFLVRGRKPLRLPNIFNGTARSSSVKVVKKTASQGSINRVYKYKVSIQL